MTFIFIAFILYEFYFSSFTILAEGVETTHQFVDAFQKVFPGSHNGQ